MTEEIGEFEEEETLRRMITLRVGPKLKRKIEHVAATEKLSMNEFLVRTIKDYLRQWEEVQAVQNAQPTD